MEDMKIYEEHAGKGRYEVYVRFNSGREADYLADVVVSPPGRVKLVWFEQTKARTGLVLTKVIKNVVIPVRNVELVQVIDTTGKVPGE